PQGHERVPDLAHARVRNADHGNRTDGRVLVEHVLDLRRVGVEPADDKHVFGAVGDSDVPAIVHHADVAGVQPSVAVHRLPGPFGIVDEPLHDVVAAHHDLAGLAARDLGPFVVDDEHFDAGDRATIGERDRLFVVVVMTHRRDAGRLGEAVALHYRLEPEL